MNEYIRVAAALVVATGATFVAPVEISAVIDRFGVNASVAGAIVTAELLSLAVTTLLMGFLLAPGRAPPMMMGGLVLLVATQLASMFPDGLAWFSACRVVSGIACGAVYAIACTWASSSANAVRMFSVAITTSGVVFAGMMIFIPRTAETYGLRGFFGPLSVLAAAAMVIMLFVPPGRKEGTVQDTVAPMIQGGSRDRLLFAVLLLAILVANIGLQMLWTYSEEIARARKFSIDALTNALAVGTVATIVGSVIPGLVGERFGHRIPLVIGAAVGSMAGLMLMGSQDVLTFSYGLCLNGVSFFLIPYQLSAAGALDPSGRASAIAGAVALFGTALAPLAGGYVSVAASSAAVGGTSALLYAAAALASIAVKDRMTRATAS